MIQPQSGMHSPQQMAAREAFQEGDEVLLNFSVQKVENTIKNDCNVSAIPEGLINIAVDMAAGEFLMAKKTFAPEALAGLDLDTAVRQIQAGDVSTTFAVGDGSLTPEQRLDKLIGHLLNEGRSEFSCYRSIRW